MNPMIANSAEATVALSVLRFARLRFNKLTSACFLSLSPTPIIATPLALFLGVFSNCFLHRGGLAYAAAARHAFLAIRLVAVALVRREDHLLCRRRHGTFRFKREIRGALAVLDADLLFLRAELLVPGHDGVIAVGQ